MKLDLRQLRYFLAIAETGTLAYAARKLNVAQSAVSHHLAELESKLGVALVERHPRGVTLTAAGQKLHEHAQGIILAVARAEGDVRSMSQRTSGPISLGLSHTVTRRIAVPLMRDIKSSLPDILLGLVEAMSMPLTDRLLARELDIVVVYNPPQDARLESFRVLEEDICLVGTDTLLGNDTSEIAFSEAVNLPLIMPHPSETSRSIVENFHLRNQLPERIMEFDSLFAINQALIEGIGCGILAESTAQDALDSGRVIARRLVDPEVTRTLCVVKQRDHQFSRAELELLRILVGAIEADVSAGRWKARWCFSGLQPDHPKS